MGRPRALDARDESKARGASEAPDAHGAPGPNNAIVIGAGQNGLAAAARLARAGRKVVVLERRDAVGGLAGAVEFHSGYKVPGILHDEGLVSPRTVAELGLERHGLAFRDAPPIFLAEADGPGIVIGRAGRATLETAEADAEIRARSTRDAESYAGYRAFLAKLRPLLDDVMGTPPPPLSPASAGDFWQIAKRGWRLWRHGRQDTLELMRVAPMCVADFLNERFETPLLVEGLAAPAVIGTWAGPWSAGTTANLLLAEAAAGRHLAGGPAALVAALERAARAAGAELRTGAEVVRLRIENGRAVGVVLASGERVDGATVIATCDPKRSFLELIAPGTLPIRIEEEYRRIRARGTGAKVHLALSGPLDVAARPGQAFESIRIGGGHVDDLERAFDAIKYREVSPRPHLEIRVPTVADPSLAPAGHHVVSILASYAPHDVGGGWTERRRGELLESILSILERHAPRVRERIVAQELLTPTDLEERYALTGGQLHHGEPALDQMLVMRPTPSAARYATSVPGLYLGGSGSHGGGGVTCTAGLLAARAALGR
ncbi:MAG TPA: NAD(P)/FAD-dependent oxidoreductase [Thermoanaerobaculia bacterium]|nr:NAD(P)/FAD-dependent oxidoreductase [Thermoanaerobaculia bacterium]